MSGFAVALCGCLLGCTEFCFKIEFVYRNEARGFGT